MVVPVFIMRLQSGLWAAKNAFLDYFGEQTLHRILGARSATRS